MRIEKKNYHDILFRENDNFKNVVYDKQICKNTSPVGKMLGIQNFFSKK